MPFGAPRKPSDRIGTTYAVGMRDHRHVSLASRTGRECLRTVRSDPESPAQSSDSTGRTSDHRWPQRRLHIWRRRVARLPVTTRRPNPNCPKCGGRGYYDFKWPGRGTGSRSNTGPIMCNCDIEDSRPSRRRPARRSSTKSVAEQLAILHDLHKAGALTAAEFLRAKTRLLDES